MAAEKKTAGEISGAADVDRFFEQIRNITRQYRRVVECCVRREGSSGGGLPSWCGQLRA